jgi:hypothetical protein
VSKPVFYLKKGVLERVLEARKSLAKSEIDPLVRAIKAACSYKVAAAQRILWPQNSLFPIS